MSFIWKGGSSPCLVLRWHVWGGWKFVGRHKRPLIKVQLRVRGMLYFWCTHTKLQNAFWCLLRSYGSWGAPVLNSKRQSYLLYRTVLTAIARTVSVVSKPNTNFTIFLQLFTPFPVSTGLMCWCCLMSQVLINFTHICNITYLLRNSKVQTSE